MDIAEDEFGFPSAGQDSTK